MKSRKHLIPDVVSGQTLVTLKPTDTARDAAVLMDSNRVSSVLVVDSQDKLCGIFTVRDVARRIVGGHLDPDNTPLDEVMTTNLQCVAATEQPYGALRKMQDGGFRHLPVTDDGTSDGKVVGIVSRKSFFPEEEALLKWEEHFREVMR
ncbi:MAG: CBS domain-containing protein [Alphaproteobacteria bacterium]|nr:CBS domain-containing protein [Alphaproteobacteria bacterium]